MARFGRGVAGPVAALALAAAAQAGEPPFAVPVINAVTEDGQLTLTAEVSGPEGDHVEGRLAVSRALGGNSMTSSQSRDVTLGADGPARIAAISVNVDAGASVRAVLDIYRDGVLVGRARLDLGGPIEGQD